MNAWYENARTAFLDDPLDDVVGRLTMAAVEESLHIEPEQQEEWKASVGLLQRHLHDRAEIVHLLKETLKASDLSDFHHVILEYDFRRRGLRIDCVLLGKGIIAVIEFKRTSLVAADKDQVSDYAINLVEFHEETRRVCDSEECVVVPMLALTSGDAPWSANGQEFHQAPWNSVLREPLKCDRKTLHAALRAALSFRRKGQSVDASQWLQSRFSPSSTIIDAAISLYGQHDVSSINTHAAPIELINKCTEEVAACIQATLERKNNRVIFVSGAPGAGKTLVGLKLAFDPRFRKDSVFVTGNAPLVDVLSESLKKSYRPKKSQLVISGYAREQAIPVIRMSTFKIVKAHAFLGERGRATGSADGRIVIFDEAQRTYKKGRVVLRKVLEEDEALLILKSLEASYTSGAVVVALVGHNQAINSGEMGITAWFKAAKKQGWKISIADETLNIPEATEAEEPENCRAWVEQARERLTNGDLPHSLRFYRNRDLEKWAHRVLSDQPSEANAIAQRLNASDTIWMTRDLSQAKSWVRDKRVGDETAGIIASGQARRLAAHGLFVDLKPSIAHWILAPSGDIRSSNMLETVQNQYQIQGLEIDYALVCWDTDLRRDREKWKSFKINGDKWQKDSALDIAKNGYRVLLTRARKGMVIFIPEGDRSGEDLTRPPEMYDQIANYLFSCGAKVLIHLH
jgi:hypothetical protein